MQTNISISVILPVFNEERSILASTDRLVTFFESLSWDYELIFVEDGSTDATVDVIRTMQKSNYRIRLLRIRTRLGKGGSIKVAAKLYAKKKYTAYMDIDLSAPPSELLRMLDYIEKNDLVVGSRILRGRLPSIKRPIRRSLFSRLYSKLFRLLFRMPIYDPQCGIKLFRTEIIPSLFDSGSINGFAFDTELILNAFSEGLRVIEVPINWTHDENSKVNILREIRNMGMDIVSLWYSCHLLWREGELPYPFKKGSIYAKILFAVLSLGLGSKPSSHLKTADTANVSISGLNISEIISSEKEMSAADMLQHMIINNE